MSQRSIVAPAGQSGPWPSKDNRTDADFAGESGSRGIDESDYWQRARQYVDEHADDLGPIATRPIAVTGGRRLRREAVRERRVDDGTYRAKTGLEVMQQFIAWYLENEDLRLEFDGFRAPVGSSYNERATRRNYGKLCDLERGAYELCRRGGDDLYTALMGLTASHENADGRPRCIGDHLRQIVESWSNSTRQDLWRSMDDRVDGPVQRLSDADDLEEPPDYWWEYARIEEPHKSGFGHMHVAVIANFELDVGMFRSTIAKHIENTPSASWSAHPIDEDNPGESCVTIRRVDPATDSSGAVVGNLASYLSSYLCEFGDGGEFVDILDREPQEVLFRATTWATGTRNIDFSNGGHHLRALGYDLRDDDHKAPESSGDCPPPETIENARTGERFFLEEPGGVEAVAIDDAKHLDPEKHYVAGDLEATR